MIVDINEKNITNLSKEELQNWIEYFENYQAQNILASDVMINGVPINQWKGWMKSFKTIEDVIVDSDSEGEDIDEEKDSTNEVSVGMINKKKSISRSKDVIVVSDSESGGIDVEKDDSTNEVPVEMMYINESNKKKSIFRSKYSIEYDSLGNPSGVKINYSREDRENVEDAMKIWSKDRIGSTFEEVSRNFFVLKRFVIKILCKKGYDIKLNSVEDLDKLDDVINTELKIIGLNIFEFRFPNIEKVLKGLDLIEKP